MITEYELYADERKTKSPAGHYFWLGGVVCTDRGHSRLLDGLSKVRSRYGRSGEMKWANVRGHTLEAYRAWVDVFFDDPSARYSLFQIDVSSQDWSSFRPRPGRRYQDDRLASAYHQFLLVTFSPLRDTKRWSVYPDAGLFSRPDKVLDRVEFLFNRTYKLAFGPKSSRIIRVARERDSAATDLVQLADVLLGTFTFHILGERPQNRERAQLVGHAAARLSASPTTRQGPPRRSFNRWVLPKQFSYRH